MIRPLLALLFLPLLALTARAETALLDGIQITTETIAFGLEQPVFLTAPTGDPHLFVVEQTGNIRILAASGALPDPFLDLSSQISTGGGEQGLLGLAFHPLYAQNGRFFVYLTNPRGDIELREYRRVTDDLADPATARILLTVDHQAADNHNGGWIGFGPDGLLYVGTGDGGGGGDRANNAQNPDVLLGKLLRLDVDGGDPYAIPPGNPFASGGGAPEIFATGLRNPWRAGFDGDRLYIGDVGQGEFEEINVISTADAGANLGWRRMEGLGCYNADACDQTGLTLPIHVYGHDRGCSVTGGYVYRGAAMPALQGRYFFADFCDGILQSFRSERGAVADVAELGSLGQITSFGQDAAGEIYVLTYEGTILKLVGAP